MKRLVLVDGNALLHRAYHATPPLSTSSGELINAVYGFTSMLLKAISTLTPDYVAVTWDMKAPTFRHEHFAEYKAKRKPMDDGLAGQFERVHQVLDALNIPQFKLAGFEADDLVGTLTKQAKEKEKAMEIIILTGDRDIMQLIDKRVKVLMPKKTINDVGLYGEEEFALRFGFEPKQLVDFKALAGDASDNVPGVPGIGEVGATKLIQEFNTIEKVFKNLKHLPERLKNALKKGEESAILSKKLVTIDVDAPINLDLSACRLKDFKVDRVKALFEELEFKSLINKIPGIERHPRVATTTIGSNKKDSIASLQNDGSGAWDDNDASSSNTPSTTDLDHQVEKVLERMSDVGVFVDCKYLKHLGATLKDKLAHLEQEIYSIIGHQFNLNSPKQLSEVLFDELKLTVMRKTKTGRSTDEETLLQLQDTHPIIPLLLQYRQLFKLVSTYIDALPKYVGKDKRIHSTFNVEGAATGRLSSQNPNLQNIPIKGQMGSEIRKAFVAPKGKVLLSADYSQIELRIMAHLADDPGLKKAFLEGKDIHAATASKIFNVPIEKVDKGQRMVGKTMNFATLYGQGPHALSRQLGVNFAQARAYIDEYFQKFPKVKEWMGKILEDAYQKGYVETLWGRKRYFPELQSANRGFKAAGERAATNHPIQGTAADMIKQAMVEIDKELESKSYIANRISQEKTMSKSYLSAINKSCQLILQVHDELVFECSSKSVKEVASMVKEKMENALKLSVPVIAELKTGPNWGEMQALQI